MMRMKVAVNLYNNDIELAFSADGSKSFERYSLARGEARQLIRHIQQAVNKDKLAVRDPVTGRFTKGDE